MLIAVHNHFNARKLCDVDVSDDVPARLATPPKLADNLVMLPDGRVVNMPKPEEHVVLIGSGPNALRLFMARVNGEDMIVTNTPEAALARAA